MKHFLLVLILAFSSFSIAQAIDSVKADEEIKTEVPQNNPAGESRWYYGGTLGFNFWSDYFYLSIEPMVGYKISPKFSVGGKIGYSYINYSDEDFDTHNYGASIFSRYRVIPQIYLHGEFVYWSYETITGYDLQSNDYRTERNWVPFLLLGGGYVQNIGPNASLYVEVLVDVLQNENSPYEDWDPFVSFGVGIGF
ncbi:MAG TPA: hypothetical protein VIZ21_06495 [Ignavibacteriaceae bacterium]